MRRTHLIFWSIALILVVSAGLFIWLYEAKKPQIHLKPLAFSELPGWGQVQSKKSLEAFLISCKAFLRQNPEKNVGSQFIELKAKDWQKICTAALKVDKEDEGEIQAFFESWFVPAEFFDNRPVGGLFTGYYMPLIPGSLTKTEIFTVPIYSVPKNMIQVDLRKFIPDLKKRYKVVGRVKGNQLVPYYTRKDIVQGAIAKDSTVIAWIEDRVDRQFLEIEGSGVIELNSGDKVTVGYAAENGAPYTSIARILIERGVLTKHNASMQGIRRYFKEHPEEVDDVLFQNKSFVFFNSHPREEALGSQGVPLTPGYSLAVDRKWIPMGMPLYLKTVRPDKKDKKKPLERLMIAQDTGGAIRGPVRGDIYWGTGEKAIFIAGHMKNMGIYYLFLPKQYVNDYPEKFLH